jgi:hypothetical protein
MGGGLMQLVAYGAQDIYLTGNPQITFFKVVYRRHTNFAVESIEQTFNGTASLGSRVTATISRNGDLVSGMYLEAVFTGTADKPWPLEAMIDKVELEIGGQLIDRQYGDWMHIWTELTMDVAKKVQYQKMSGHNANGVVGTVASQTAYLPLQFWFCRNPGLALPLIALQYHEVKVNLELGSAYGTGSIAARRSSVATLTSLKLFVDYVYLDTDERRRFAQVSHEYLIEQVQFTGEESVNDNSTNNVTLNFNHPVKELVWVAVDQTASTNNHAFNYLESAGIRTWEVTGDGTTGSVVDGDVCGYGANMPSVKADNEFLSKAKLQLNGHDRFAERDAAYFGSVQVYQHHSGCPHPGIYVYSFALSPEEHQPSGTCNFSRIDNAVLQLTMANTTLSSVPVRVYAVNYNVLRIMSGMGGLAYSN